jgi:soluble lytic murein transglycosylase-like protein
MHAVTSRLVRYAIAGAAVLPAVCAACWSDAERLYGVSSHLLYAVARVESGLHADALNLSHRTRTGTYDIGLMQINSGHLPKLASFGIAERDLLEPCTSIMVGAWLLAESFARRGVSWDAVGAYNAACTQLKGDDCASARSRYAWRVYQKLPGVSNTPAAQQAVRPHRAPSPVPESAAPSTPAVFILSARVAP